MSASPPGTYQICPICYWEDARSLYELGTNEISLWEAQDNFGKFGVCQPKGADLVRKPNANDQRLSNWRTLAQSYETDRSEVLRQIELAFEKVKLEDGITLLEARLIDCYEFDYSRKKKDKNERLQQQKEHNCLFGSSHVNSYMLKGILVDCLETLALNKWQDIPNQLIERLFDVLPFLDPKGFRFYIPAYMTWTLVFGDNSNSTSSDSTVYALTGGQYQFPKIKVMNQDQSQAICQFLRFLALYKRDDDAITALKEYWGKFCQEKSGRVYYLDVYFDEKTTS